MSTTDTEDAAMLPVEPEVKKKKRATTAKKAAVEAVEAVAPPAPARRRLSSSLPSKAKR